MLLNSARVIGRANVKSKFLNTCISDSPKLMFSRNDGSYADGHYVKTSMTQYLPEEGFTLQITGFNGYGFTINQSITAVGPVIMFPKTIFSWNIEGAHQINEHSLSLFKHLEPKTDILIIGTGERLTRIDPAIPKWLIKNKINNFEILPTDKAINAFNFLVGENRFVSAALIPALIRRDRDNDAQKHIERLELYKQIDAQNPNTDMANRQKQMIQKAIEFDKKLPDGSSKK